MNDEQMQPLQSDEVRSLPLIPRRQFLALGAMSILPAFLTTACQVQPSATDDANANGLATPTADEWSGLAKHLQGTLVRPDNPQYATAKQLFSPDFDKVQPAAVVYCASPDDIKTCLSFAQQHGLPVAPRTGGHSYAGYSTTTGIILDITHMSKITINATASTATIGAGARLIDVYDALAKQNFALPAGSCPTVGIAGLTLGGGVGVLGRKFGLTCDNLLSAQVVLANGRIVTCDASHEPDLFWALQGGGGGNFGVVTSFTFKIHKITALSLFTLRWPWSSAADVIGSWQNWAPGAQDEIWSNCVLIAPADKSAQPIIQVNGVFVGDVTTLNGVLKNLTDQIDSAPSSRYVTNSGLIETMLYEAGCADVNSCHLPAQNPQGTVKRDASRVKSDYFVDPLPEAGINALINAINQRHASTMLGDGGIGLDAYGGAINRIAPDATAFVHRNARFSAQYSGSWNADDADTVVQANHDWLNTTWQVMRSYASGQSYQNYVDPDLSGWQEAYYGANLTRLKRVKAEYDPKNFFRFGQSIPLR